MRWLSNGNTKMALEAIKASRWRSMLTMSGIIIGIIGVVTTVSLGEGIRHRIVDDINRAGSDLLTIKPGSPFQHGTALERLSLAESAFGQAFGRDDLRAIESLGDIRSVTPFSYVTGAVKQDRRVYADGPVIGTSDGLPQILRQRVEYGVFFDDDEAARNGAVLGRHVARRLFREDAPIGKLFSIRSEVFVVRGVFEEFDVSPLATPLDYNKAIFIPHETGRQITDGEAPIYQILARPEQGRSLHTATEAIRQGLSRARGGQEDFSVLTATDQVNSANQVLHATTGFIFAIAAVSLLVAGIGILNIMLVSVTERTREIGMRKAIGATNRQILRQFMTEAIILSWLGGIFGVLGALLVNYLLRIFTPLAPVVTWQMVGAAALISVLIGIIAGVAPAMGAARKNPIEALRSE